MLQVLSNLVENALRSTPAGGSVTRARRARRAARRRTPARASRADDLPRAFERFYLYDRYGRERRAVGTGLGLAIVKELTEAMGGSVAVESAVGRGTTFVVRLPRGGTQKAWRSRRAGGYATRLKVPPRITGRPAQVSCRRSKVSRLPSIVQRYFPTTLQASGPLLLS